MILMDEPASALDPIATTRVEELIGIEKGLHHRHSDTQHATGDRISDYTAFFYIGELVEFDGTTKIFTNPARKQTEDYVTGRFG